VTARAVVLLAAVLVVALAPAGDARVLLMPTIPSTCRGGPSWAKVAACLERFGKLTVLDSSADVKLVQLSGDGVERGYRTEGIYLYKARNKQWGLGGMREGEGYTRVALTRFKTGRFTGYRFDLRKTENRYVQLHARNRPAHVRKTLAVFCSGQSSGCSEVLLACDVYVDGKTYWTFRGTPELTNGGLFVRGDRSTAGFECAQDEESWLPPFDD
jgi:hypothetical protein